MSDYADDNWGLGDWVGSYETDGESYEFSLVGVIKGDDGYYLSTDSGCSCPTPWESHTRDDWTGPLTAEQAKEEATSLAESYSGGIRYPDDLRELLNDIV